mgnify:CR=1 FL=1
MAVAGVAGAALLLGACDDLDVNNPNEPDADRALATAGDVESLIASSYKSYFQPAQQYDPGNMLSVMADQTTSSWGNFAMRSQGSEPRDAFNNSPSFTYAFSNEFAWTGCYAALAAVSDGFKAIEGEVTLENETRARAFGRFVQGVCHGFLAMIYDQAAIVDETVNLSEGTPELRPYGEVMNQALSYLDQAIQLAENNTFTLPASPWINGAERSSAELARIAHSYRARFMAAVARSPDERANVDWQGVIDHVDQGIQSDLMVDGAASDGWWSGIKTLGADYAGWSRVDYRQIGPADTSGAYEARMSTPVADRTPIDIQTPDQRFPAASDSAEGGYFQYLAAIPHPPVRGTYHRSHYVDTRYQAYAFSCNFCWTGMVPEMTVTEMNLLKAEALMRTGSPGQAADIINQTRTANGGLPEVTADGVPDSNSCVPQNADGSCGDLMDALQYEWGVEVFQVSAGLAWAHDRGWGELVSGTPVHMPVPGSELEVLQKEIYTFGGEAGGAAPSVQWNDAASVDRRIENDLKMLERIQKMAPDGRQGLRPNKKQ